MPDKSKKTLSGSIFEVLGISDARQNDWRVERQHTCAWQPSRRLIDRAAEHPFLSPPCEVQRRHITQSAPGQIALPHAIAHIELNAVDLALHMARRFTKTQLPVDFYHDWLGVADDET